MSTCSRRSEGRGTSRGRARAEAPRLPAGRPLRGLAQVLWILGETGVDLREHVRVAVAEQVARGDRVDAVLQRLRGEGLPERAQVELAAVLEGEPGDRAPPVADLLLVLRLRALQPSRVDVRPPEPRELRDRDALLPHDPPAEGHLEPDEGAVDGVPGPGGAVAVPEDRPDGV